MKRTLVAAAIATFSLNAFSAQSFSNGPAWDFVEAGYQTAEVDGIDEFEPSGFTIKGSYAFAENFYINASYRDLSDDEMGIDLDLSQASLGVGYRYAVTRSTDVFGTLSFENLEAEAKGFGENVKGDESGYGIAAGVRSMIIDQLELTAAAKYIDLDDSSETGFEAGAVYYFTPAIAVGATYEKLDDFSFTSVNLRYAF